ncbi:MAG: hypothetical protein ACLUR5_13820 [Eubacterium ventriosum]
MLEESTKFCLAMITGIVMWLKFNERVLDEASDEDVPLCERLTFVSIFSTNLDEFYRVKSRLNL